MTEKRKSALAAQRNHTRYDLFRTFVPTTGNTVERGTRRQNTPSAPASGPCCGTRRASGALPFDYNPKGYQPNLIP